MTPTTKFNYFSRVGIVFCFLCSSLFVSCSTSEKRLKKEQLTISYRSQSSFEGEVRGLRLQHPIKVSTEQTTNHLLSLHYEEFSLLGKKKYVFSPNDVLEIAPLIAKTLNRIKPGKILYYEVETPSGKTVGTIFRAKGKINWRFKTINGRNFSSTNFGQGKGSAWQLLPQKGQKFHKEHSILGNEQKGNWIISNLKLPVKSKRGLKLGILKKISGKKFPNTSKQKSSFKQPSNKKGEFQKRLQFLKSLLEKKLIDDNEYKNKKEALLDAFP